ncbi:transposase IS66 family protein [Burkholderia pseudomallei MSHR543]|nr:transposase IS66 family protein [Burkholderia pseudomallei MSHR543]
MTADLSRLPRAAKAYIHELEARAAADAQRIAERDARIDELIMHRMGEEVSEQLHMEVKVSVLQHARAKYACRHCERHGVRTPIVVAPMPAQPLPGSHASPSMIAAVTAGKYIDGTPLYRMEDVLARSNIAVSRGTLANWIIRLAELHYMRIYDDSSRFCGANG